MDYIDIQKLDKNGFTIHIIEIMLVLSLINGIINLYDEKKFFIIEFLMIILFHLAGNKIILENLSFFWQSIKLIGVYILHLLITTDVGMDDNNINPKSIEREIAESIVDYEIIKEDSIDKIKKNYKSQAEIEKEIKHLDKQIKKLAEELNFEEAIKLRDKMNELKKLLLEL